MSWKHALTAIAVIGVAAGAITWWALEGSEVVVIHTVSAEGSPRTTRVWIADEGTVSWIEAATPERPFYQHILAHPRVELDRNGQRRPYLAEAVPNPDGHRHIRQLLRAKYGLADYWVGLLQSTSRSQAIRLQPSPD
ncbi:MAG: nitroreductase/quinone reductase family protein [Candidatus Binataceae bacterium]